jgi:hypothetical protein
MIRNAVLDAQGEGPLEQSSPVHQEDVTADVDVVQALLEAVHRPGNALELPPDTRVRRPFDAQYWACWVAATLFPVLMAYLWITR